MDNKNNLLIALGECNFKKVVPLANQHSINQIYNGTTIFNLFILHAAKIVSNQPNKLKSILIILEHLKSIKPNINYSNETTGKKIILELIEQGLNTTNFPIFEKLLTFDNLKINVLDYKGNNAFHYCLTFGSEKKIDTIKLLAQKKCDFTAINNHHETVLNLACKYNDDNSFLYLIKNPTIHNQINLTDQYKMTPLMYSAKNNNLIMLQTLVELEANPLLQNKDNNTALDLLKISTKNLPIISLLSTYQSFYKLQNTLSDNHQTIHKHKI
jgi:ankyrin repeat protein